MQLPPPTPPNTPAHTPAQLSTPTPSSGGSPFGHGIAPAHGVASTPNAHASGAAAAVPATPNNAGATPTAHQVNRLESDPFVLLSPGGSVIHMLDGGMNPNVARGNVIPHPNDIDPRWLQHTFGYYLVIKGTQPGWYDTLPEAQARIHGISGNSWKHFSNFGKAKRYWTLCYAADAIEVLPGPYPVTPVLAAAIPAVSNASAAVAPSSTAPPSAVAAAPFATAAAPSVMAPSIVVVPPTPSAAHTNSTGPTHLGPAFSPSTPVQNHRGTASSPIVIPGTPSPARHVNNALDLSPIIIPFSVLPPPSPINAANALVQDGAAAPSTPTKARTTVAGAGSPTGSNASTPRARQEPFASPSLLAIFNANVSSPATFVRGSSVTAEAGSSPPVYETDEGDFEDDFGYEDFMAFVNEPGVSEKLDAALRGEKTT